MAQIGNVPEINRVKESLKKLKDNNAILEWDLPYEYLLTRLSAAIFFLTPTTEEKIVEIQNELGQFPNFHICKNTEKVLSKLEYRVEFLDVTMK